MSALTRSDVERHVALGIAPAILKAAKVVRVTTEQARELGIANKGDLSGVYYPKLHPLTGRRVGGRVRRDHPEIDAATGMPRGKYLSGYSDNHHLYFPPNCRELLRDTTVPLAFVEAEKSVLAVESTRVRVGRLILPIGTGGCWGWSGMVGKTVDESGARVSETGPSNDFNLLALDSRAVYVAFDANAASNWKVRGARKSLVNYLESQGADVRVVSLPEEAGVNGPDDFIGRHGDEAFLALLDSAKPLEPRRRPEIIDVLGKDSELFHAPDSAAYVTVVEEGVRSTFAVKSHTFQQWLSRQFYIRDGKTLTQTALNDAVRTITGCALFDGPEQPVFVRVGYTENAIYFDLGTDDWRAIRITAHGWDVVDEVPVKFRRSDGMLPLPLPERDGDIRELRRFINVPDDDGFWLVVSWCVMALHHRGPYPVLILTGEQGCAKSTATRLVRRIVDPHYADIRPLPSNGYHLAIAANNSHVLAFDNLSSIDAETSDSLCRVATGGAFSTRTLYETTGETILKATKPIILNGIDQPASRGDLLDRAIVINLPMIEDNKRETEREIEAAFDAVLPRVLGALLDAVVRALQDHQALELSNVPRLADYAFWTAAAAPAFGLPETAFLEAFGRNRRVAQAILLDGDPVGSAVVALLDQRQSWDGTAAELLRLLNDNRHGAGPTPHGWPTTPRKLSGDLRRLAPLFRADGIGLHMGSREGHTGRRLIYITRQPVSTDTSGSTNGRNNGDGVAAGWVTVTDGGSSQRALPFGRGDGGDDGDGPLADDDEEEL